MTLQELGDNIRKTEEGIGADLRNTLNKATQIGNWLLEAKKKVKHGQWEAWVKELVKPTVASARLYMSIAKNPEKVKTVNTIKGFTQFTHNAIKDQRKLERKTLIDDARKAMVPNSKDWQVFCSDNRKYDFPMVDAIWTDPPWGQWEITFGWLVWQRRS
jgi:hypothetical protein